MFSRRAGGRARGPRSHPPGCPARPHPTLTPSPASQDAKLKLVETVEDLDHLRDNVITVEVNMARVYNFDVKVRRDKKDKEEQAALNAAA